MIECISHRFQIIQKVEKELKDFEFNCDDKSPYWLILAKRAKYEFMRNLVLEIYDFGFTMEESTALLADDGCFLELCWIFWAEDEKTLYETIEDALKVLTYKDDDDA